MMSGERAAKRVAACFLLLAVAVPVAVCSASASGIAESTEHSVNVGPAVRCSESAMPQMVTIIVGVIVVLLQVYLQHRSELRLQQENYRERLRLQVYREISAAVTDASARVRDAHLYAFTLPASLEMFHDALARGGLAPSPVKQRAEDFAAKHGDAERSLHGLVNLLGTYEVTVPRLDIFSIALEATAHDLREEFQRLHRHLLDVLPIEIRIKDGSNQTVNVKDLSREQLRELNGLTSSYSSAGLTLISYLLDLKVELQNRLVGPLFGVSVARRCPIDPEVKVITTDAEDYAPLRRYFLEDTEWGKTWQQARVRAREVH